MGGSDDVSDRSESSRRRHWRIVERGRVLKRRKDANFRVPIYFLYVILFNECVFLERKMDGDKEELTVV